MKLELKHIAPYLPYQLKCELMGECIDGTEYDENPTPKIFTLTGISNIGTKDIEIGNAFFHADDSEYHHEVESCEFFPILRPLSDITKPCLEGGLIPIVELAKISYGKLKWEAFLKNNECYIGTINYPEQYKMFYSKKEYSFYVYTKNTGEMKSVPYQLELFEKLYEWHFDVYGLIEQDLAIDINTLN